MTEVHDDLDYKTAVALGAFDGMHIGHTEVIKHILGKEGLESLVFTFSGDKPLPKLSGEGGSLLMTFEEKKKAIEDMGIDNIYTPDFDEIRDMSPEDFVAKILKKKLNARYVVCGYDFRFGKDAAGNAELLTELCKKNGIRCEIVPEITLDGQKVSSTEIRTLLRDGAPAAANRLLGREFSLSMPVLQGTQLGRTIGFPTINQKIPYNMVQPRFGVYSSRVSFDGKSYRGITDIGVKPTVKDDEEVITETYIIDFEGDLYGKTVTVSLLFYIREEKKFYDLDALRRQLADDLDYAKKH